jgi:hypothetical protein
MQTRQTSTRAPATGRVARTVVVAVAVAVGGIASAGCAPLVLATMRPRGPFAAEAAGPPPDYRRDDAWLALPETLDDADVRLPDEPAVTGGAASRTRRAAVFYLHSTSSVAARWNVADEGDVRTASIAGGTRIQGSVFNDSGEVFAPGYRQASGIAFLEPSADGAAAIALAQGDVERAFAEFLARIDEQPFLIAGHSQGSFLAAELVRRRVAGSPALRGRLVAAVLIGAPLRAGSTDLPPCASPTQTGCLITFNARAEGHDPQHPFEFPHDGAPTCAPPDGVDDDDDDDGDAVFFDADPAARLRRFALGRCAEGFLVVRHGPLPDRGFAPRLLLAVMGGKNLHSVEYQLFYGALRADADRRVKAWHEARAGGGPE